MIAALAAAALAAPCEVPKGGEVACGRTAGAQAPTELDSGADVDPESLRVEGGELVWTRGGARRSAAFP